MGHSRYDAAARGRAAWNAGKTVGTKRPLTQKQIWAIRFFLDRERRVRDRALFDLAIDSKLRGCDLVKIKTGDLVTGPEVRTRATVIQQKTGRPVQFELTSDVRASLSAWLERRGGTVGDHAFPFDVTEDYMLELGIEVAKSRAGSPLFGPAYSLRALGLVPPAVDGEGELIEWPGSKFDFSRFDPEQMVTLDSSLEGYIRNLLKGCR